MLLMIPNIPIPRPRRPKFQKDGIHVPTVFTFRFEGLAKLAKSTNEAGVIGRSQLVETQIADDVQISLDGNHVVFNGTE